MFKKSEKESKHLASHRKRRDDKFFMEQVEKYNKNREREQVQMCIWEDGGGQEKFLNFVQYGKDNSEPSGRRGEGIHKLFKC